MEGENRIMPVNSQENFMFEFSKFILASMILLSLSGCDDIQKELKNAQRSPEEKANAMLSKPVTQIDASVLCPIFNFGSEFTDLQRERIENDIKGKVVRWRLQVYEVSSTSEKNVYRVQTQSCTPKSKVESFNVLEQKLLDSMRELGGDIGMSLAKNFEQNHNVPTFLTLVARNDEEVNKINGLKTGDWIEVQGEITGTFMRVIELNPVIFYSQNELNTVKRLEKQDDMSEENTKKNVTEFKSNDNGAFEDCIATAKKSVTAIENSGENIECFDGKNIKGEPIEICPAIMNKGEVVTVSQIWENKYSNNPSLCVHGDYCYPLNDFELVGNCDALKRPNENDY